MPFFINNLFKKSFRNTISVSNSFNSVQDQCSVIPGFEVIKLEFIIKHKIMRNDWLLGDTCPRQPIIALYFEFETVLKFMTSRPGLSPNCLQRLAADYKSCH